MGSNTAATLLLLIAAVPAVLAVTFQVGDFAGWSSAVNYTAWASGKTFRVGDTLEFQYGSSHSVSVVDKAGFDDCDGTGATQSFSDGDTKIDLTTVGTMHFLCPTPGHCSDGMKLAVPVLATASSPTTPSPPPSPRTPPSSTPSPPPSPRTPPSSTPSPPPSPRTPSSSTPSPPPPSASPPANGTPDSESSPSPSTSSPSPSPPNAASKGVISYGMIGMTMVLMYGVMS